LPTEKTTIESLSKEYRRLQRQKYSTTGNVEARVLENICFANGENVYVRRGILRQAPQDQHRVHMSIPLIGQRMGKVLGRLSAFAPSFKAQPKGNDAEKTAGAEVASNLIIAQDQRLDQPSVTREILEWCGLGGVAFEYCRWVPDSSVDQLPVRDEAGDLLFRDLSQPDPASAIVPQSIVEEQVAAGIPPETFEIHEELQMTGDIQVDVLGPLNVFVDHSVKDLRKLAPDQSVSIALPRTVEWVKENWGEEGQDTAQFNLDNLTGSRDIKIVLTNLTQVGDSLSGINLSSLLPAIQGTAGDDDPDMVVVVERYMARSKKNPRGRYTVFVPDEGILFDDENPYPEIPIIDYHWSPVTTTFWTGGYVEKGKSIIKAIQRTLGDMREYGNAFAKAPMLLGPQVDAADFTPNDMPRYVPKGISPDGVPQVMQAPMAQIPGWFTNMPDQLMTIFDELMGGADLTSNSNFPGQLRGTGVVARLQEIMDTEWGTLYRHLGERFSRSKQLRLNIWRDFAPASRTLHFVDDALRNEVLEYHREDAFPSDVNYNVSVQRDTLIPQLQADKQALLAERMNTFPMMYQTSEGQWDKEKIAAEGQFGEVARPGKEQRARKLAGQILGKLKTAQPPIPPNQLMDFAPMIDEFQIVIVSDEFPDFSPQVQQSIEEYYSALAQMGQEQQQQAAELQQNQNIEAITNQAAQQAAAAVAADVAQLTQDTVFEGLRQAQAQGQSIDSLIAQTEPQREF